MTWTKTGTIRGTIVDGVTQNDTSFQFTAQGSDVGSPVSFLVLGIDGGSPTATSAGHIDGGTL